MENCLFITIYFAIMALKCNKPLGSAKVARKSRQWHLDSEYRWSKFHFRNSVKTAIEGWWFSDIANYRSKIKCTIRGDRVKYFMEMSMISTPIILIHLLYFHMITGTQQNKSWGYAKTMIVSTNRCINRKLNGEHVSQLDQLLFVVVLLTSNFWSRCLHPVF